MCSNGQLTKVDCAGGTVWNDNAKTCDWTSDTCSESGKNNYVSLVNPCPAKFNNLNFYPLGVVYRYRDPQLQVAKNYSYLFNLSRNICKSLCLDRHFIPNSVKLNDLDLLSFTELANTRSMGEGSYKPCFHRVTSLRFTE